MNTYFSINKVPWYNVIRSHNRLRDGSNLNRTISYHNLFWGWPLINHLLLDLPKFLDQLYNLFFWSTYAINLLNQLTIQLVIPLAYGTLLPQTYVCKRIYSYLLSYIWFKWLTFLQIIYLSSCRVYHSQAILIAVWMKFSLDIAKTFLLCRHYLHQSINIRTLTRMTKASWWIDQWRSSLTSV